MSPPFGHNRPYLVALCGFPPSDLPGPNRVPQILRVSTFPKYLSASDAALFKLLKNCF